MGRILPEVSNDHLRRFPDERALIGAFASEYDVSWATRRTAYRSDFSVYILRPETAIKNIFGFEGEIALFIFAYDKLEPRSVQAINQVLQESPLTGRVDPSTYILVSKDPKTREWSAQYTATHSQAMTQVALSFEQIRSVSSRFDLRSLMGEILFRRDLFDYKLPIISNSYFFGREDIIPKIKDQIRKGQNTGLFGLRKTGKTSILYRLLRDSEETDLFKVIYLDCKSPSVRKKTAAELIDYINKEIASKARIKPSVYINLDVYDAFQAVVRVATKNKQLCIIFDEIEYISPFAKLDPHWHRDFIDLWQLIWSTQSINSSLSTVIGGVNAGVCESPEYSGVQNPLFSIVNIDYIQGLDSVSLNRMVKYFGSQMGLNFSEPAIAKLALHYGGHPLLTRMACSFVHRVYETNGIARPVAINDAELNELLASCDAEISTYCAHVVSELKEFYKDEYEILMMASAGNASEFFDFAMDGSFTRHLTSYGILQLTAQGVPQITLPVLKGYLAREFARTSGTRIPRALIDKQLRAKWVESIRDRITRDLRSLLQSLTATNLSPFGTRGVPDADIWAQNIIVSGKENFRTFISSAYQVFYENIIRHLSNQNEFNNSFKTEWPAMHSIVAKIKVYRDFIMHLDVSERTKKKYEEFTTADIGGISPDNVTDGWFALQQAIMDELLYAIQVETASRAA